MLIFVLITSHCSAKNQEERRKAKFNEFHYKTLFLWLCLPMASVVVVSKTFHN
jgi:hypothetical protein